jgi:hypothetical protein
VEVRVVFRKRVKRRKSIRVIEVRVVMNGRGSEGRDE